MKIGLVFPQTEAGGDPRAIGRIGIGAEQLGYASLTVYDHVLGASHDREPPLTGGYDETHPFHDPFVMFAYLAGVTRTIELVTGVMVLPQRQTVLVAKQAADVDLLSNERLRLGVGIGWNHVEYAAMGQDFGTRGKRLEEQVALLRKLWREPLVRFEGRFDTVDRAALVPRPRRTIPIWMGGFAPVARRRAAALADGFIFADTTGAAFDQLPELRGFLAETGRAEGFGMHLDMLQAKSAAAVVDLALRWRDAGGTHAAVNTMGQGLATADAHLAYATDVAEALQKAGLL